MKNTSRNYSDRLQVLLGLAVHSAYSPADVGTAVPISFVAPNISIADSLEYDEQGPRLLFASFYRSVDEKVKLVPLSLFLLFSDPL